MTLELFPETKKQKDDTFQRVVAVWCEEYPILGKCFSDVDGRNIKSIIKKTKAHIEGSGKVITPEFVANSFRYVVAYVKREKHFCDGKPLTTWNSQYLSIIHEIVNGKQTSKKPTTRDIIKNL